MRTGKDFVGVIAQDIQKITPYMVDDWTYTDSTNQSTNYLSLNNGAMTYMLINSVKEQQQQLNTLKARVDDLVRLNTELIKKLEGKGNGLKK